MFKKIKNKKIKLNLNRKNVFEKNIAIKNNEGFLCNHTIKKVFNFKPSEDEKETMFGFAKVFVDAGIKVPKETFVKLFEKLN